ncbi:hypothetical protein [Chitinilyticum aquatile]|uniref:hypothetical protein n=1 Tax=Chitinilyticum aquatile TaxID=362520 RepID=UPI0003F4CBEC|nr:hypothetical protein [Chitinilyticum aquatile]
MTRRRIPIAILTSLQLMLGASALADTFTGTLGGKPVVVELSTDQHGQPDGGQYGYLSQGRVLLLRKSERAGLLEEYRVKSPGDEVVSGYWSLRRAGRGWEGQWLKQPGANGLPLHLEPAALPEETTQALGQTIQPSLRPELFNLLLAQSPALAIRTGKTQSQAGLRITPLRWQRGEALVAASVQLAEPAQPGDAAVNAALRLLLQGSIVDAEYCSAVAGDFQDFQLKSTITYASTRYLNIQTQTESNCGGPHPNAGYGSSVYDRQSGQEIALGKQVYQIDGPQQATFRQLVAATLKRQLSKDERGDECYAAYLADPAGTEYPWLRLNGIDGKGVIVSLGYAHAEQACGLDLTLPYASLARFRRTDAPAHFGKP